MDMDTRVEMYKEFQQLFVEELMFWMPGVQNKIYAAYDSGLQGIEMPGEYWVWNNAYFEN